MAYWRGAVILPHVDKERVAWGAEDTHLKVALEEFVVEVIRDLVGHILFCFKGEQVLRKTLKD